MKEENLEPNNQKLMSLFSLFFFATSTLLIRIFFILEEIKIPELLNFSLLIFSILSYEFILIEIVTHYSLKGKKKLVKNFNENKKNYILGIEIFLGISYIIFNYFYTKNFLTIIRDIILATLMICALPPTNELITKIWKTKK